MSIDRVLIEQILIDCYLRDAALEPAVVSHRADVERAGIGLRNHHVLAHAAGLTVCGLIPLDAVDPDVDRTRIHGDVLTGNPLTLQVVLGDDVKPLVRLKQAVDWLPEPSRAEAGDRVENISGQSIRTSAGASVHTAFPLAGGRVCFTFAQVVDVPIPDRIVEIESVW